MTVHRISTSLLYPLLSVAAATTPLIAHAEEAAMACTTIEDNAARLACFDKVYAAQLPPSSDVLATTNTPKRPIDLSKSWDASVDQGTTTVVLAKPTNQEAIINTDAYTPLSTLYDLDQNDSNGILTVRAHNPMYLLPGWFNSKPNYNPGTPSQDTVHYSREDQKKIEAKMQISFKTKLLEDLFRTRADLWFGYTQQSHWQVWNGHTSAQFRNTDYMPELFITQPVHANLPWGGKLRMIGAGYLHQSNGQSDPLSRSWNRIYAMAGAEWGNLTVIPRVWWRIPESKSDDNNPDINRYMGYGDLRLQYRFSDAKTLGTTLRLNPKTGKGSMQLDYSFPLVGKLKGYVQAYDGYGESLLDYNHRHRSIGIGILMNDWDGF
ncbi:phospholipase A [Snodgrassella sp. CFCC 13594]|uniref:phospholipase A n=1 Tax=Snodgrassella sp. CFCC 13594 TaxID=1775559 RepID=UPI00082A4547|nr:phospholipase A [Snodgrassella sp. CFCC 13594]